MNLRSEFSGGKMTKIQAFFEEAFNDMPEVPPDIKRAAEHIVVSYGIRGICDPGYIANTIAFHIGRGDGKSRFWDKADTK